MSIINYHLIKNLLVIVLFWVLSFKLNAFLETMDFFLSFCCCCCCGSGCYLAKMEYIRREEREGERDID